MPRLAVHLAPAVPAPAAEAALTAVQAVPHYVIPDAAQAAVRRAIQLAIPRA